MLETNFDKLFDYAVFGVEFDEDSVGFSISFSLIFEIVIDFNYFCGLNFSL